MFERVRCHVAVVSIAVVTFATPSWAVVSLAGSEMISNCGLEVSGPAPDRLQGPAPVSPIRTGAELRLRDLTPMLPLGHTVGPTDAPHPTLRPNAKGGWKDASFTVKFWSIVGTVVVVGIIAASMDD